MVRLLPFNASNENDVGDSNKNSNNLMRKMTLGSKFGDENGGLLKNIHSFLRPKRRNSNTSSSVSQSTAKEEELDLDLDQDQDEDMNVMNFNLQDGSSSASSSFSQSGNSSPLPAIQKSVSTLITDTKNPNTGGNVDTNGDSVDQKLTVEAFFNQPIPPSRSLHRSRSSASVSPCKRPMGPLRHSSLSLNRKDRKSMRYGSRTGGSLRKMNTMDSPTSDIFAPPSLKFHSRSSSNSLQSARRRAMESRLSQSSIPHFYDENCSSDNYPRITAETLRTIMDYGAHKPQYDSFCIIDCRFEYEFKGGHISNALNICSREGLELEFIQEIRPYPTLLIFYCEFSAYRSPLMASHLRNCDRISNYEEYPNLFYPDILILEGGYKSFFDKFPHLCYPCNYVRMNSTENLNSRDQELDRFRQDSKKLVSRNSSLSRLATMSISTSSVTNKQQPPQQPRGPLHPHKTNSSTSSPFFKYEPPPKLSLFKQGSSPFLSSDESCSSSRISFTNSPNLSSSKMLAADAMDLESCYSFDDNESTFTTSPGIFGTPTMSGSGGVSHYNKHDLEYNNSSLNPVKKSLFPDILLEEENERVK
ncbi:hypothetical protein ZYGR_0AS00420 [Zygosaccharomyces rouxii]|uniref:M-phase inducer phosphatase n=1 Tax=Zygosaccharomyces rouxii TaxID=4956 RepID=A0A1Q3AGD8_ZYGRO|nr:hypothetical protein ZYGR_0AS00420 [Zygosaccharomyces rouxii]